MPRERKPVPPYIRNLVPSVIRKGMFDISWNNITYTMPLHLARHLADYFKDIHNKDVSVQHWYQQLAEEEREKVLMTPNGKL